MIFKEIELGSTASEKRVRPALPHESRGEPSSDDGGTALDYYFGDMKEVRQRCPLLTPQKEIELAKRIEAGRGASEKLDSGVDLSPTERSGLMLLKEAGERARTEFIEANLSLVVSIAKGYLGRGMELADLIQDGNLGLIMAVERFD